MQLLPILVSISSLSLSVLASRETSRNFRSRALRSPNSTISLDKRDTFVVEDFYQGEDFLNKFDFFSDADPTNGLVNYLTKKDAQSKNLAFVQEDGTTILAVDNTTELKSGQNRDSVRISSQKKYNSGLFIADFWAMPHGCSVWPAYWTVGSNWPEDGEVDIVEGVNEGTVNQYTLHTSNGCTTTTTNEVSANKLGTQCASSNGDNTGCAFQDTDEKSYGHGFNMVAGGVFAHLWDSGGIKVWRFSRDEIPADITSKNPNPDSWGTPVAQWASKTCDIASHFVDHGITIDTTLCGDFAGSAFPGQGCSGTCADAVADPTNFKYAKWMINYIAVYQRE